MIFIYLLFSPSDFHLQFSCLQVPKCSFINFPFHFEESSPIKKAKTTTTRNTLMSSSSSNNNNLQQQQQPISVDEALKLFNEVQQLTVRDAQDNERFAESRTNSTPSNSNTTKRTSSSSALTNKNQSGNATGTTSSSSRGSYVGTEAELRRQLELSEAVMKKLHAKNKALTQEIDDLKRGGGAKKSSSSSNGGTTATPRNSENSLLSAAEVAELDSLRRRVVDQDAQIKQLVLKQQQTQVNAQKSTTTTTTTLNQAQQGKPPLAISSSSANQQENSSSSNNGSSCSSSVKLLEKRIQQLQQQYDSLLEVKLECIREGESTGKVNKEVKAFFVTSRQKMMDDAAFHEAERVLLNQKIAQLERELDVSVRK